MYSMIYRCASLVLKHSNTLKWWGRWFVRPQNRTWWSLGTRTDSLGETQRSYMPLFHRCKDRWEWGAMPTGRDVRAPCLRFLSPCASTGLTKRIGLADGLVPFALHSMKAHIYSGRNTRGRKAFIWTRRYKFCASPHPNIYKQQCPQ